MKVAVVGLGLMGRLHTRIFTDILGTSNVVGIEVDPNAASGAASDLGIEVIPKLSSVLEDVSAVSVTLPDDLHLDASISALAAGKYVLVEKPLAKSSEECAKILAARLPEDRLMVGHVLRFDLRLQELRRKIEDGTIGEIRYLRIRRTNNVGSARRLGGRVSVVGFLGVHDLDLLRWLSGQDIVHATAEGRCVLGDVPDLSVAMLTMSGGAFAVVENHWLLHEGWSRTCLADVEVYGSEGMALVDLSTGELDVTADRLGSKRIDTRNWTHDENVSGGSLRRELEMFLSMVRGERGPAVSGEDGAAAVAAVEMIEQELVAP